MAAPKGYSCATMKDFIGHDFGASEPQEINQIRAMHEKVIPIGQPPQITPRDPAAAIIQKPHRLRLHPGRAQNITQPQGLQHPRPVG